MTIKQDQLNANKDRQEKTIISASEWTQKYQRQSCPPAQVESRDHVTKLLQVVRERHDSSCALGRTLLGYLASPDSRPDSTAILQEVLCHIQGLDVATLRNLESDYESTSTPSKE